MIVVSIILVIYFWINPISSKGTLRKIVNEKGYTVASQESVEVTLSIPKSLLPESIYSEEGYEFSNDEVIAYNDGVTTIYLKSAKYANEGNDNLYLGFDFSYNLPKDSGKLVYPYNVGENGYTGSVSVKDGSMRDEETVYSDAVEDRGQDEKELMWFYVSTDALKQAEGTISFDINLNYISYLKDGV